jgi:anti-sigma regulatory factor (Ser/Thr protein kinase)
VLASAPSSRGEQRGPVPLSSLINAATSEVEDYRRVETSMVPDCAITGAASGDIVHLLAELIDNALRYSPPASPVRVSASQRSDAAVLLEIVDVGLGMTDGDRRIANMRLRAGGEVTPDSARHMGLFVVGRLADRHGIRVRLRGSSIEQARSGSTAEVYLPATLLAGADGGYTAPPDTAAARPAVSVAADEPAAAADYSDTGDFAALADTAERNGSHSTESPVTLLPQRRPGSSGITAVPADQPDRPSRRKLQLRRREEVVEPIAEPPAAQPASNTSSFFGSRVRFTRQQPPETEPVAPEPAAVSDAQEIDDAWSAEAAAPSNESPETDLIYQRMLSEWLVDPRDLARSADLDWKSVWDRGWSVAAEVENVPVQAHTDHGLPVRDPGARLVPGGAGPEHNGIAGVAHHRAAEDNGAPSNGGFGSSWSGRKPAHEAPVRDPEAIRASMSSHFGGVRAGRSHARDTDQGPDHE